MYIKRVYLFHHIKCLGDFELTRERERETETETETGTDRDRDRQRQRQRQRQRDRDRETERQRERERRSTRGCRHSFVGLYVNGRSILPPTS